MKQTLCLLALLIIAGLSSRAQTADSTSDPGYTAVAPRHQVVSPTQRAARQLTVFQKELNLNQDQVIQLRTVLLRLYVALDSLRSNPSGDKKADNQARRAINQDADARIYAVLTTDQQVAYAQWKQEQQLKRQLNQAAHKAPAADSTAQHP